MMTSYAQADHRDDWVDRPLLCIHERIVHVLAPLKVYKVQQGQETMQFKSAVVEHGILENHIIDLSWSDILD